MKSLLAKVSVFIVPALVFGLAGCSMHFHKRTPTDLAAIDHLQTQLEMERQQKENELSALRRTMQELENALEAEIEQEQIRVGMEDRGLVITFVDEVLFDSGKAELRPDGAATLDKVSSILGRQVANKYVSIEGHTDNQPIKHSGWKSNWELSTARANSVLHELIDSAGLNPSRFRAAGYGEYRPVADNNVKEGRQQNRRVEVVVLPEQFPTVDRQNWQNNNSGYDQGSGSEAGRYIK
ncbi:MAG: flagellar motor protein MotB [Candidatus Omnitrophica bacterium]|nr:flagellar motor protein MotB [Candidatus Omnitrophota bacterium]